MKYNIIITLLLSTSWLNAKNDWIRLVDKVQKYDYNYNERWNQKESDSVFLSFKHPKDTFEAFTQIHKIILETYSYKNNLLKKFYPIVEHSNLKPTEKLKLLELLYFDPQTLSVEHGFHYNRKRRSLKNFKKGPRELLVQAFNQEGDFTYFDRYIQLSKDTSILHTPIPETVDNISNFGKLLIKYQREDIAYPILQISSPYYALGLKAKQEAGKMNSLTADTLFYKAIIGLYKNKGYSIKSFSYPGHFHYEFIFDCAIKEVFAFNNSGSSGNKALLLTYLNEYEAAREVIKSNFDTINDNDLYMWEAIHELAQFDKDTLNILVSQAKIEQIEKYVPQKEKLDYIISEFEYEEETKKGVVLSLNHSSNRAGFQFESGIGFGSSIVPFGPAFTITANHIYDSENKANGIVGKISWNALLHSSIEHTILWIDGEKIQYPRACLGIGLSYFTIGYRYSYINHLTNKSITPHQFSIGINLAYLKN